MSAGVSDAVNSPPRNALRRLVWQSPDSSGMRMKSLIVSRQQRFAFCYSKERNAMLQILTLLVVIAAVVIALALAWLPMQVLTSQMARRIRQFIQRQRERRHARRK